MAELFLSQLQQLASSSPTLPTEQLHSLTHSLLHSLTQLDLTLDSPLTQQGSSALMILAAMGRRDLMEVLLHPLPNAHTPSQTNSSTHSLTHSNWSPPTIDRVNNNGTTALVFACSMGHLPEATLLCEYGANINVAVASGDTPLMIAAAEGFNDIVTYLCECDHLLIECTNECGQTALHCAVEGGHLLTASLLLDRGANLEATDNVQATPLLVACANGFVDLARMLLERGAKTACVSERVLTMKCDRDVSGATTVDSVKIALIDLLRSYSWVPALDFHRFCQQDDVTNIKRLFDTYPLLARRVYNHVFSAGTTDVEVSEGSSVMCRFGGGASPLMVACLHNSLAVVKFLLEEYDVDYSNKSASFLLEETSDDGRTCLFYAAWSGALSVMKYLVHVAEKCCFHLNINATNKDGRSALYYACHNGHVDCVAYLISMGADKSGISTASLEEMPMKFSAFKIQNSTRADQALSCGASTLPDGSTSTETISDGRPKSDEGCTSDDAGIAAARVAIVNLLFCEKT